jgi:hypothetical protein
VHPWAQSRVGWLQAWQLCVAAQSPQAWATSFCRMGMRHRQVLPSTHHQVACQPELHLKGHRQRPEECIQHAHYLRGNNHLPAPQQQPTPQVPCEHPSSHHPICMRATCLKQLPGCIYLNQHCDSQY